MKSAYDIHRLTRRYGDAFTLEIERMEAASGEVLCLVGPTGCGKSTLLRLLAGVERPSAGELLFETWPMHERPLPLEVQRQVTLVFQRPLVLAGTVEFNIGYGLRLRRRKNTGDRLAFIIDKLGLTPLLHRSARNLSVGQTQLVALARALALEPKVLLLDEPTASLDPAHVALVESTIKELNPERHTTVVWATHNIFQAKRVADRVAFLLNGKLIELSAKADFFDRPADPRTAAFVRGDMVC
jgi:tungstate transport system ATP-binding protein